MGEGEMGDVPRYVLMAIAPVMDDRGARLQGAESAPLATENTLTPPRMVGPAYAK
jgi:hypothetical protein